MTANVLRGAAAIGAHLGIGARQVDHLHRQRQLPTFRLPPDSAVHATVAGLDDWRSLEASRPMLGLARPDGATP